MNEWIEFLKENNYIGVKKHIKNGADVNDATETGESVLAYAIKSRCDKELISLLIENGADIYDFDNEGVSIFDIAITYDNIWLVKYFIEKGINVNKTMRKSGFTPLMAAASYGRVEITKLLLEQGADKDAQDLKGFSATDFARKMNKKSILEVLDFDPNAPQNRAFTR